MELNNELSIESLSFKFPLQMYLDIPIDLNIKNVYYNFEETLDFEVFDVDYNCEKSNEIKMITRNFNFIDTTTKLYDNQSKNFLEYYELESVDDLLFIIDEIDIGKLNAYIEKYKGILQREYIRRLNKLFRLNQTKPTINLKNKLPEPDDDIKAFTVRDRTFMLMQLSNEYNPTPRFEENKDKTMNEWSFRETELHLAYLTSKTRIESLENEYSAKCQEDMCDKGND